jgi:TonB family protein
MKLWAGILLGTLITVGAAAQTSQQTEQALKDALLKKQMYLRGFSGDAAVHWIWENGVLVLQPPQFRVLEATIPRSVKVKGNKVEIEGDRLWLYRNNDSTFALAKIDSVVRILVDLKGADMASVLPKLVDMLFFPDRDAALAALPERYRETMPPYLDASRIKTAATDFMHCDCARLDGEACHARGMTMNTNGMKPPQLTFSVAPEIPKTAIATKQDGNVQVELTIDTSGKPEDVWIVRPTGTAFDENAARAVSQYRFNPATCHGKPVQVSLIIDVNFQIF